MGSLSSHLVSSVGRIVPATWTWLRSFHFWIEKQGLVGSHLLKMTTQTVLLGLDSRMDFKACGSSSPCTSLPIDTKKVWKS